MLPCCWAFDHWNLLWKDRDRQPRRPTVEEQRGHTPCSFQRASGEPADCQIERDTQEFLLKYLPSNASVFEFGARYGTTSCMIASIQHNSGKLVAIEPDNTVWAALERNRRTHACKFATVEGLITDVDNPHFAIRRGSYSTNVFNVDAIQHPKWKRFGQKQRNQLQYYRWKEVERAFGIYPDTLVLDCEGCVSTLFSGENLNRLEQVDMIILEHDFAGSREWVRTLTTSHGFIERVLSVSRFNHSMLVRRAPSLVSRGSTAPFRAI